MAGTWQTRTLGELVIFKTGKLDSNAAVANGEYPFFTCSQETFRTNTFSFDVECVLLAGNNANGIYPLKYFCGKFDAYQRTYVITTRDPDQLVIRFLYYALRQKLSEFRSLSTGAATKFLTMSILNRTEILVPSLEQQQRIVSILGAYDDLMEVNRRRMALLEETARRMFEEWFVHFRYPGHDSNAMVSSSEKEMPKGWKIERLSQVLATLEAGSRPKGGIREGDGDVPSIGAENINGLGKYDFGKEKLIPRSFFSQMRRGIVRDHDVLLYKDGAHVGRKAMFRDGYPYAECAVNEHVFILRPLPPITPSFLYFWLDQPDMTSKIKGLNSNAAQPGLNQSGVNSLSILQPPAPLVAQYSEMVEPILALLFQLAKANRFLSSSRDLLLPRLVSGELAVSGAERELQAVA